MRLSDEIEKIIPFLPLKRLARSAQACTSSSCAEASFHMERPSSGQVSGPLLESSPLNEAKDYVYFVL